MHQAIDQVHTVHTDHCHDFISTTLDESVPNNLLTHMNRPNEHLLILYQCLILKLNRGNEIQVRTR